MNTVAVINSTKSILPGLMLPIKLKRPQLLTGIKQLDKEKKMQGQKGKTRKTMQGNKKKKLKLCKR